MPTDRRTTHRFVQTGRARALAVALALVGLAAPAPPAAAAADPGIRWQFDTGG